MKVFLEIYLTSSGFILITPFNTGSEVGGGGGGGGGAEGISGAEALIELILDGDADGACPDSTTILVIGNGCKKNFFPIQRAKIDGWMDFTSETGGGGNSGSISSLTF